VLACTLGQCESSPVSSARNTPLASLLMTDELYLRQPHSRLTDDCAIGLVASSDGYQGCVHIRTCMSDLSPPPIPLTCMLTDDNMWRRFVKYNDLLRDFGANLEGCKGNKYITTTHVINSAIVKLSKLTKATKIYRGVGGGVLPESFWRPNTQGVKGGIESAFMSTTFERAVAMKYATSDTSKPALVFEMQMGMVDRGAELDWVSQYPHEKGERLRVCAFFAAHPNR
jgi:hypothetical protein